MSGLLVGREISDGIPMPAQGMLRCFHSNVWSWNIRMLHTAFPYNMRIFTRKPWNNWEETELEATCGLRLRGGMFSFCGQDETHLSAGESNTTVNSEGRDPQIQLTAATGQKVLLAASSFPSPPCFVVAFWGTTWIQRCNKEETERGRNVEIVKRHLVANNKRFAFL